MSRSIDHQPTFVIETWGCQMNVHDSEKISGLLLRAGYCATDSAETADVVILNTCSVREKAAQKVFTRLGRLAQIRDEKKRKAKPNGGPTFQTPILCVAGCVAQQEAEGLIKRVTAVDVVIGTRRIDHLPKLLERVMDGDGPVISTDLTQPSSEFEWQRRKSHFRKAYVTVTEGCSNSCAYCIVPSVRGPERSRDRRDVLSEIRQLTDDGVIEVELLGQNVNSYRDGRYGFEDLIQEVSRIPEIRRIRFTVSHPRDFSPGLARLMSKDRKVCNHLHLPVQSGSDRILEAMNRGYTRREYLEKIELVRTLIPHIALSTDLIVGFPGETDGDHQRTLSLMEQIGYDATFSFQYSPRPGTHAASLVDDVPGEMKLRRLNELQSLQRQIQIKRHRALVGKELEILVAGKSKRGGGGQYFGRDEGNRVVNFQYPGELDLSYPSSPIGSMAIVRVSEAHPNSLVGKLKRLEESP